MNDQDPNDDDDLNAFQAAMEGVKPLRQDKVLNRPETRNRKRSGSAAEQQTAHQTSGTSEAWQPVEPEAELSHQGGGLQSRQFKKLRQGQIPVEARLDLHGQTLAQAEQSLGRFFDDCQRQGLRCVMVVHGKGQTDRHQGFGIKTAVNYWLKEDRRVVGFHSAQPRDGGRGAVYVLLRKAR